MIDHLPKAQVESSDYNYSESRVSICKHMSEYSQDFFVGASIVIPDPRSEKNVDRLTLGKGLDHKNTDSGNRRAYGHLAHFIFQHVII